MRTVTAWLAVICIVLGLSLYVASGRESVTALIPAFLGVGLSICALVATTERRRLRATQVAALLALGGLGGGIPGVPAVLKHLAGEAIERPAAAWGRAGLAVLCAVFLVLALRFFVLARRTRAAP